jgi:hypothetical protein
MEEIEVGKTYGYQPASVRGVGREWRVMPVRVERKLDGRGYAGIHVEVTSENMGNVPWKCKASSLVRIDGEKGDTSDD